MSQQNEYTIQCPKCGESQAVKLYESINTKTDPALKELLMANQLNSVNCPKCRLTFRVDKTLLYHDPDRKMMIYLVPLADNNVEAGIRQFSDSLRKLHQILPEDVKGPQVSLVFSRTDLIERIFLHEAGLNERIIEYIKYLIYSRNMDRVNPADKQLLFNAQDSTADALCFVVQDVKTKKLESVLQYDRKTYKALSEMFDRDEQTAVLLELFPGPHISARALILKDLQAGGSEGRARPTEPPAKP